MKNHTNATSLQSNNKSFPMISLRIIFCVSLLLVLIGCTSYDTTGVKNLPDSEVGVLKLDDGKHGEARLVSLDGKPARTGLFGGTIKLLPGHHHMTFVVEAVFWRSEYERTIELDTKAGMHYEFHFLWSEKNKKVYINSKIVEVETGKTFSEVARQ